MAQLIFGNNPKLIFQNDQDFFETLGMIASRKHCTTVIEPNHLSGARGHEGRVKVTSGPTLFNPSMQNRYTVGVGNVLHRISCTDYVEHLINCYGFQLDPNKPSTAVREVLPPTMAHIQSILTQAELAFFNAGYAR